MTGPLPESLGRAVLLLHTLPDHSQHIDWLFERFPGGPLFAFRTGARPDLDAAGFTAERIGDHRPAYLAYEGSIAGNRGEVRRLGAGRSILRIDSDLALTVDQDWGAGWQRFTGEPIGTGGTIWRFLSTRVGWRDDPIAGIL